MINPETVIRKVLHGMVAWAAFSVFWLIVFFVPVAAVFVVLDWLVNG